MIPNTVHRLWLGPHPMPAEYAAYGDSWRDHGYTVIDWTDDTHPAPINIDIWDRISRHVDVGGGIPETGVHVQHADLLSYELVLQFGGIYANCDMECRRRLDLDGIACFAAWEMQDDWVGSAIFGATAWHPFMQAVVDRLPGRYHQFEHHPMNEQTGPHLLTEVHRSTPGLHVFDEALFYPYGFGSMDLEGRPDLWARPDAYTEHHWGHQKPHLVLGGPSDE